MDRQELGTFIRQRVLPTGLSVTKAAKQLDVTRAALSRLLNGQAALSKEMALKLEKVFGADAGALLAMFTESEPRPTRSASALTAAASAYAAPLHKISHLDIAQWANHHSSRTRLPVLVRRLVHSTGRELTTVDFPGNDDGERKGNDGLTDATLASPWVPSGRSYWELGTDAMPKPKAEKDYQARLKSLSKKIRLASTFIFVTPRHWPGRDAWAESKRSANDWSDVRAYDASSLEQWLETSATSQVWLAEELGRPSKGIVTVSEFWESWSKAVKPQISPEIFAASVESNSEKFEKWITSAPERALTTSADSRDEAIALLACMLMSQPQRVADNALVIEDPETAKQLVDGPRPPIVIAKNADVEQVIAPYHDRTHCLLIRPRGNVTTTIDLPSVLMTREAFCSGLKEMGYDKEEAERLAAKTGRSPTVLRRYLDETGSVSRLPGIENITIARTLLAVALLGTWSSHSTADQAIVSKMVTGFEDRYNQVDVALSQLEAGDESPIWRASGLIGMVSKTDALFSLGRLATANDLDEFIGVAEKVLSEDDPALDLPEEDRWAASIYDKNRNHSEHLREGIGDTLVFLSVDGQALLGDRLSINLKQVVDRLIRDLLTPMTERKLRAQIGNLPIYAEASPDEFLAAFEGDIRHDEPISLRLMKSGNGRWPTGRVDRVSLLWALQRLAWGHLGRVSLLLGELARQPIDDNISPNPIETLESLFSWWMPQTSASLVDRTKALDKLTHKFPDVGTRVCFSLIERGGRMATMNSKPVRRSDAVGFGKPVAAYSKEIADYRIHALDLILNQTELTVSTLTSLLDTIEGFDASLQERIWMKLESWSGEDRSDQERAQLRRRLRERFGTIASDEHLPGASVRGTAAFRSLKPSDLVQRHAWLFQGDWINWTFYELRQEKKSRDDRESLISSRRATAIEEIWNSHGMNGVLRLASTSDAPYAIGRTLQSTGLIASPSELLKTLLNHDATDLYKRWWITNGFLRELPSDEEASLRRTLMESQSEEQRLELCLVMAFEAKTWEIVSEQSIATQKKYWSTVDVRHSVFDASDASTALHNLLAEDRPRDAFEAVKFRWEELDTEELLELLSAFGKSNQKAPVQLDPYTLSDIFAELSKRPDTPTDRLLRLEYAFLPVLTGSAYGTPLVQEAIQNDPAMFVQMLALTYRRRDGREHPEEWRIDDSSLATQFARTSYELLDNLHIVPRTEQRKVDEVKLTRWVRAARALCREHDLSEIGDVKLGELFAREVKDEDTGLRLEIARAMEETASDKLLSGFITGVLNSRGIYMRGSDGGAAERKLAEQYRTYADAIEYDCPFVARGFSKVADRYDDEARQVDEEEVARNRLH